MTKIKIGHFSFELTHLDKLIFPQNKYTKKDVLEYYYNIAPLMLTHLKNRPLNMQRFPNGIEEEGFYQKDASPYFPEWINRITIPKKEGGVTHYVVCENSATLLYLVNQGCLTPHLWLSTINHLNEPDRLIFDLDPSNSRQFNLIKQTARQLKQLLETHKLNPQVMLTGSRGLHVTIPLKQTASFDDVKNFGRFIAQQIIQQNPKELTLENRKEKRGNRLLIDINRNAFAQTAVAPYALRPKPGAPVAAPIDWDELDDSQLTSQRYNLYSIFDRLKKAGDPWKNFKKQAKKLPFLPS